MMEFFWHIAAALAAGMGEGRVLACMGKYLVYLLACVIVLLVARMLFPISRELWRKLLHIVAYTSSLCMMAVSGDWLTAAACCALFAVIIYPILAALERWKGYDRLFSQRHAGEVKKSLLLLFFTHAALIAVCWGLLGKPFIAVTAILMWGTGDAMAALVGKRYGKHRIHLRHADMRKTWEGTSAMAATALVFGFAALVITSPYGWPVCLGLALICAPVAAYVELISHDGHDTATVACAVAAVLAVMTGCMSLLDSYDASDAALAAMAEASAQGKATVFVPEGEIRSGLIFYPGGLVEHEAYAPLLQACAERGVLCLLTEMPLDLAVLDMNAADGLQDAYPEIERWMIGGHSLGGAMAASYADKHAQDYDALVLLGAYSTADLTDTMLSVLSVVGTQDGVINREKYAESMKNYPTDFTELALEGGCHAYFGDYGAQAGDGTPAITRQQQIDATADAIAALLE